MHKNIFMCMLCSNYSKDMNSCVASTKCDHGNMFSYSTVDDFDDEGYLDTTDTVNHPNHYQSKSGLEAIDVISAFTEDLCGIEAVCTGNILKYACRWKKKNGIEDLRKIIKYSEILINELENK